MSVSVCTTMIGARPSVRILLGAPVIVPTTSMPLPGSPSGCARAGAAVDHEPVELVGERLDAVDVGGERERRLRLADREHPLRGERAEHVDALRRAQRACDLGVDVVRERVARMDQVAVAGRVDVLDALARRRRPRPAGR